MYMSNLKEVSRITFEHEGWVFKIWILKAYDSDDNLICTVGEKDEPNFLKYVRFVTTLKKKGYKLRKCDCDRLKSGGFSTKFDLSQATKSYFYEIAKIAEIPADKINNIRTLPRIEQENIAECLGLEYHELMDNLDKF